VQNKGKFEEMEESVNLCSIYVNVVWDVERRRMSKNKVRSDVNKIKMA
jgi:hypothetical protein